MKSDPDKKHPEPLFIPFRNKRSFEEIADQIKELIFAGVLKKGDKLPSERELANQFNMGRMVVREALRTLEESGLIYIKHGSLGGAFIKDADSSVITRSISDMVKIGDVKLADLTEARWGIEKIVLELVFERIGDKDITLLEKNITESEKRISKGMSILDDELEFHMILARASGNPLLATIVESIITVTKSFVSIRNRPLHHEKILHYHKEIRQALKDKSLSVCLDKMHAHILAMIKHLS